jgi:hypothetical protein
MRAENSVGAHRPIAGLALGAALVACGRSQNKTTRSAAGNAVPAAARERDRSIAPPPPARAPATPRP